MKKIYILFLLWRYTISSQINYIINGDFELPVITPTNAQYNGCPTNWTCYNIQMLGRQYDSNILYGQFVDMELYGFANLSQVVQLPFSGTCNLDFRQGFFSSWGSYSRSLQIWWNGVLIQTTSNNMGMGNLKHNVVRGVQGANLLLLKEVGAADWGGTLIDNFSLICVFDKKLIEATEDQQKQIFTPIIMQYFSIFLSTPIYALSSSRYLYLFLSDMWLYNYDIRNYTGVIDEIFATISFIDNTKLEILSIWINFSNYKQFLHMQKYVQFTKQRFLQIEGSSSTLLDSNFQFFIFAGPQTTALCVLLYLLFLLIKDYKISRIIRPYYFIKTTIIQCLFQQNISYFAYVCFNHLHISFSFWFYDRLSLSLTVVFFFCVVAYSLCFCYLIRNYLKKHSIYFHIKIKRQLAGYSLLTAKNSVRSFLRGSVYFFLRQFYGIEMLSLSLIELSIVLLTLINNISQKGYQCKTHFCLQLLYHLLHCVLNLAFFLEYVLDGENFSAKQEILSYVLQTQVLIIYILITLVLLNMLYDMLGFQSSPTKSTKKSKQKVNKKVQIKHEVKVQIQESANVLKAVNHHSVQKEAKYQLKPKIKGKESHIFETMRVQVLRNNEFFGR